MSDTTNDIEALRMFMQDGCDFGTEGDSETAKRLHAALTALVAERDALKQRVAELTGDLNVLVADRSVSTERLDAAKKRIAELESHPPAASDLRVQNEITIRWMNQVTMMLCHSMTHSHDARQELAARCDNAIAAMRKGGGA